MAVFYNQATLQVGDVTVTSNVVSGEVVCELSMTKTAVNGTYQPGAVITYAVSLINTGAAAYTGLTLTDDLGTYTLESGVTAVPLTYAEGSVLYFQNGMPQPAPQVVSESPLILGGITIPAEGTAMLLYQAVVNEYASPTGEIVNTISSTGARLTEAVSASDTIHAAAAPILSILKSISPASVPENGTVTYTFELQNSGSQAVEEGAVLSDLFDPILNDPNVTYNGTAWTQGTEYTYAPETGLFTTTTGQITIPAASASQDPDTGVWTLVPGTATLVVTGTI